MFDRPMRRIDPFAALFIALALMLAILVLVFALNGGDPREALASLGFCAGLGLIGWLVNWGARP
jgi:apolipoprotein N-acyltransferase